jgi:hypothetical protein
MLHVVLDQQEISNFFIIKDIFLSFAAFLSFFGFCVENSKNGPSQR